jgi:hypothetical protein
LKYGLKWYIILFREKKKGNENERRKTCRTAERKEKA